MSLTPIVTIEEPNHRPMWILAGTTATSVALAIAVWQISGGIKWSLIIVALGQAGYWIIQGVAMLIQRIYTGRAEIIRAKGEASAARIRARRD